MSSRNIMDFKSVQEYKELASKIVLPTRAIIDGKLVPARSGRTFTSINPATGQQLAQIAECGLDDVELAVAAARRVHDSRIWCDMDIIERKTILLRFADLIEKNREELAIIETLDSGKPIFDTLIGDIDEALSCLRFAFEAIDKINGDLPPSNSNELGIVCREPVGVCVAIVPWNFPIICAAMKIGPILAAGNTLIVKPAKMTSMTTIKLGELALEAGVPDGVFNVLTGSGELIGDALSKHPDVDLVAFTGSTEVGKGLLVNSGKTNAKKVLLEMGGKSPSVVMPDVDMDSAVEEIVLGALWNMGENCTQNSRLIVHESIKDLLLKKIKDEVKIKWPVGDPFDSNTRVGSLISESHLQNVLKAVALTKENNGTLVQGGNRVLEETGGAFMEPAIFDNCSQDMEIMHREIFGPLFCIETFKTTEEAIKMANDTEYGLHASVYCNDVNTIHSLTQKIRAGVISVNHFSEGNVCCPFGGFKQSGFISRDKALAGNRQYMETKTIFLRLK